MKNTGLEAYCSQIESHFFRWKGRPGVLGPEDFNRVQRWYEEGVPLEAVLEAISEAFRARQAGRDGGIEEVNSLGYCDNIVRRTWQRRKDL